MFDQYLAYLGNDTREGSLLLCDTGASDYTEASDYIRYRFECVNRQSKEIYSHFTNATDTTNVDFVFEASMSIVLQENLKEAGIY